jgi:hypothetical protein
MSGGRYVFAEDAIVLFDLDKFLRFLGLGEYP